MKKLLKWCATGTHSFIHLLEIVYPHIIQCELDIGIGQETVGKYCLGPFSSSPPPHLPLRPPAADGWAAGAMENVLASLFTDFEHHAGTLATNFGMEGEGQRRPQPPPPRG